MQHKNSSVGELLKIHLEGFNSQQMDRHCVGGEGINQQVVEETPCLLSQSHTGITHHDISMVQATRKIVEKAGIFGDGHDQRIDIKKSPSLTGKGMAAIAPAPRPTMPTDAGREFS